MKLDLTKIEGYSGMTAEEKVSAIEGFDFDYIPKPQLDKALSQIAELKKKVTESLSTEEAKSAERDEQLEHLKSELEKANRERNIAKNVSNLIEIGYVKDLANETAEAMIDGDMEKVLTNQKKFFSEREKTLKAEWMKDTPRPEEGDTANKMTKENFQKMPLRDKAKIAQENPELYKELTKREE